MPPVEQAVEESEFVFVGYIVEKRLERNFFEQRQQRIVQHEGEVLTIEVIQVYKGEVEEVVQVRNSKGSCMVMGLNVGFGVVVLGYLDSESGFIEMDHCTHSSTTRRNSENEHPLLDYLTTLEPTREFGEQRKEQIRSQLPEDGSKLRIFGVFE
jgi:hypothetical protein